MIAHATILTHTVLGALGAGAVAGYCVLWARSRQRRFAEALAWSLGITVLLVSTVPPVEDAAARSFTWHMVQHLVIGVVAAPLLVLARPGRVVGAGLPAARPALHRLRPRSGFGGYAVGAFVAVALVFVAHVGAVYDLALRNRPVHDLQHVAFLVSGIALWACALGTRPARGPGRFLAGFAAASALTLLSVWLLMMDAPLSHEYVDRVGAADALRDQRFGAGLMWVGMVALTMPLLMLAVWRWASAEQHMAERREALAAREALASRACRGTSRSTSRAAAATKPSGSPTT